MKHMIVYTDGACSNNGNNGTGGWAYVEVVRCDCGIKTNIVSGNKQGTTNNEMELTAVYMALVKALKSEAKRVTIYSDSAYVVNAIEKEWLLNWHGNGWETREGKPIKNKHIWEKMYKLVYGKGMIVKFVKVKGHDKDILNQLADEAAVSASKQ